jgi:putative ABC transport system permease protein
LRTQDYRFGLVPVSALLAGFGGFVNTGSSFTAMLLLLGGLVLGIACVNYANLATARAAHRVREIGVRKAIGASPAQIAAQSIVEAWAFTLAALVIALAMFVALQPIVKRLLGAELDGSFFRNLSAWPALAALVVVVTFAAGAYPAFAVSRVRPMSAIAVVQARLGSALFSTLLVGAQFAVGSFLLIALAVISMQNSHMRRDALSAIEDPLVLIENPARQTHVAPDTLRERLAGLSQVRGVTELRFAPWESYQLMNAMRAPDPASPRRGAMLRQVGFDFFDVFSIRVVAGRVFDRKHAEDSPAATSQSTTEAPTPKSIVIDRAFAASLGFATPSDAVDQLLYRPTPPSAQAPLPPVRIIGVVEDRSFGFFRTPNNASGAAYQMMDNLEITVARVSAADLERGLQRIDAAWHDLAPNVALSRRFLDDVFERAYALYLRINELFAALALMAFGICVAGLFAMTTFVTSRRRREIGVRKTLGATTPGMILLLLTSFSKPVVVANIVAWPAAYFAARTYLNQFSPSIKLTPWPFLLSCAITVAIACLAVAGQTVRAARTTPAEVLRHN